MWRVRGNAGEVAAEMHRGNSYLQAGTVGRKSLETAKEVGRSFAVATALALPRKTAGLCTGVALWRKTVQLFAGRIDFGMED